MKSSWSSSSSSTTRDTTSPRSGWSGLNPGGRRSDQSAGGASMNPAVLAALALLGAAGDFAFAQTIEGVVHREGDERYRLTFDASGAATVEVSGAPADCALQVGSQGFQESDSSPVDWTDGQPGQTVRHSFRVQSGRPGVIWVMLRSRLSGIGGNGWSAVACSNYGPYYATPDRQHGLGAAPGSFEGRPIRPPITFRLVAQVEGAPRTSTQAGRRRARPNDVGGPATLRNDRLGFSVDYPAGWSATPEGRTFTLTGPIGAPASEAVVTVTVVPKSSVPDSSDLEILLRLHNRLVEMGAELSKLGPATVGGQTAAFASHTYDDRNAQGRTVPFDHVQLVLDHGVNYYLIAFVAPHEVFVQQTAAFKQIFGAWRFLR
jgi:hypothetical protein